MVVAGISRIMKNTNNERNTTRRNFFFFFIGSCAVCSEVFDIIATDNYTMLEAIQCLIVVNIRAKIII
jgi:hypothetical protein